MREIIRSNDPVLVSFVQVLLRDGGIASMLADENMSVLEGSIGILQRRLLVAAAEWDRAERLLVDADLGQWVWRGDVG